MLHLYRIYNLHPVIHENLRPEKPPKPFPRASVDDDGTTAVPRRRKSKRKRKDTNGDVAGTWSNGELSFVILTFICPYDGLRQMLWRLVLLTSGRT